MANFDGRTLTEGMIAEIDKVTVSPSERATYVYDILKRNSAEVTNWDVLCFCAEWIAAQSALYAWLEKDARSLSHIVYVAHYMNPETIDNASVIKRERGGDTPEHSVSSSIQQGEPEENGIGIIEKSE